MLNAHVHVINTRTLSMCIIVCYSMLGVEQRDCIMHCAGDHYRETVGSNFGTFPSSPQCGFDHLFQVTAKAGFTVLASLHAMEQVWTSGLLTFSCQTQFSSLVPRPHTPPGFDCLQYAKMEGEGLGNRDT